MTSDEVRSRLDDDRVRLGGFAAGGIASGSAGADGDKLARRTIASSAVTVAPLSRCSTRTFTRWSSSWAFSMSVSRSASRRTHPNTREPGTNASKLTSGRVATNSGSWISSGTRSRTRQRRLGWAMVPGGYGGDPGADMACWYPDGHPAAREAGAVLFPVDGEALSGPAACRP